MAQRSSSSFVIFLCRTNKKEDPSFREELKQVFSTLNLLMSHQENKVKDVYLVQVSITAISAHSNRNTSSFLRVLCFQTFPQCSAMW